MSPPAMLEGLPSTKINLCFHVNLYYHQDRPQQEPDVTHHYELPLVKITLNIKDTFFSCLNKHGRSPWTSTLPFEVWFDS